MKSFVTENKVTNLFFSTLEIFLFIALKQNISAHKNLNTFIHNNYSQHAFFVRISERISFEAF